MIDRSDIRNSDGPEMQIGLLNHPLFTRMMLLQTNPVIELFRVIRSVILLRESGCCFQGWPGVGKTSALDVVAAMLQQQIPNLYVLPYDTQNQQMPSIRAFFKRFLSALKHPERRGETPDLRDRVVERLIDKGLASGLNIVVLFIDEASSLNVIDFDFLKDVYNDLNKAGIQLTTILMGQEPDLSILIDKIQAKPRWDITGRFATRMLRFRAFNSVDDLRFILRGIDTAEYPEGSGITWTQAFFPEGYASGFRLENETGHLYSAIAKLSLHKDENGAFDFPARELFTAIKYFISENRQQDKKHFVVPASSWDEAVSYSKIEKSINQMAMAKANPKNEVSY